MKHNSGFKTILAAMFAAMICVCTMLIHIPMPATGGYANPGDGMILTCAFLLSPTHAVAAAGVGSMLADLLAGYATFAPGTLVIKALMAAVAAQLHIHFSRKARTPILSMLIAGIAAEVLMVLGYFAYESLVLGYGIGAAASIPGNIGQGVVGVGVALILTPALSRSHEIRELLEKTRSK